MNDKEFIKMFKQNEYCPERIIELAKTPFQKAVAVEFYSQDLRVKIIEKDISWIKKIQWAIFGTVLLATLGQYVIQYVIPWVQSSLG